MVPKFLLDANLSPKTSRFLSNRFGFDVYPLQGSSLVRLQDHEVIRLARSQGRVIITLDRDYAEYFYRTARPSIGIIYLDLPNTHRFIDEINRILERFFEHLEEDTDLQRSLVILTDQTVSIVRRA